MPLRQHRQTGKAALHAAFIGETEQVISLAGTAHHQRGHRRSRIIRATDDQRTVRPEPRPEPATGTGPQQDIPCPLARFGGDFVIADRTLGVQLDVFDTQRPHDLGDNLFQAGLTACQQRGCTVHQDGRTVTAGNGQRYLIPADGTGNPVYAPGHYNIRPDANLNRNTSRHTFWKDAIGQTKTHRPGIGGDKKVAVDTVAGPVGMHLPTDDDRHFVQVIILGCLFILRSHSGRLPR